MMMDAYANGLNVSENEGSARKKRQSSTATTTIELMVYVDSAVQTDAVRNGFSVVDYILGMINIVSDISMF